jgi:hypothetical protein
MRFIKPLSKGIDETQARSPRTCRELSREGDKDIRSMVAFSNA